MDSNIQSQDAAVGSDIVSDCRLMLRYALKGAIDISPDLVKEIAQIDSILRLRGFAPALST